MAVPSEKTVLSEQILEAAGKCPEGFLLAAKQFLALGTRDAVDQALRRLATRGKLVKITRGRYALPVCSRFGTRPPAPEAVMGRSAMSSASSRSPSARQPPGTSCWPIALPARRSVP